MQFKLGDKKKIYDGRFIKLWATDFLDKEGKPQIWESMAKSDVIAVFPLTEDGKVILIKNYRVPVEAYVIETPAGMMDHDGESHETAIRRELLEETGYDAAKFYPLPAWPYRSGSSQNKIYGFIATGLKKINNAIGDATEDIEVMEVPVAELMNLWLKPEPGVFFQPEIIAMYQAAIEMGLIKTAGGQ